jgi:Holliday junction resolvasome RuvABC endonuclease subunit
MTDPHSALFVAVDPGLAETGVVVFDLGKARWIGERVSVFDVEDVAPLLLEVKLIKTETHASLTARLHTLAADFRAYLDVLTENRTKPVRVAIEMPAVAGNYGRNYAGGVGTRANLDKLYFATGALVGVAPSAKLFRSMGTKKEHKRAIAERIWKAARPSERFPHSDVMDALFLGGSLIQRSCWLEAGV